MRTLVKLERPKTENKVFRGKLKSAIAVTVAYRIFSFGQRKAICKLYTIRSRSQLWSLQVQNCTSKIERVQLL